MQCEGKGNTKLRDENRVHKKPRLIRGLFEEACVSKRHSLYDQIVRIGDRKLWLRQCNATGRVRPSFWTKTEYIRNSDLIRGFFETVCASKRQYLYEQIVRNGDGKLWLSQCNATGRVKTELRDQKTQSTYVKKPQLIHEFLEVTCISERQHVGEGIGRNDDRKLVA